MRRAEDCPPYQDGRTGAVNSALNGEASSEPVAERSPACSKLWPTWRSSLQLNRKHRWSTALSSDLSSAGLKRWRLHQRGTVWHFDTAKRLIAGRSVDNSWPANCGACQRSKDCMDDWTGRHSCSAGAEAQACLHPTSTGGTVGSFARLTACPVPVNQVFRVWPVVFHLAGTRSSASARLIVVSLSSCPGWVWSAGADASG